MATFKEKFVNALFGTPTVNYGAENQAYLDELAKQQEFQNLAQRNNLTLDEALAGVMQGRNYSDKNIAQRQQELGINTPQNKEEVALADRGLLNNYTTRQGGFFNDLASGYRENATQGFDVNNLAPQKKGVATKIGEGLGTLARFYNKPTGRMAVATGLSMLTDEANPLGEGVKAYVGRQTNMTQDKVYRNQLKQLGMTDDEVNAIPGIVTKDIFEGVTSGMRLGNQRMTYGQLAMFDDNVKQMVLSNPELSNVYVPVSFGRDVYSKKGEQADSKMAEIAAKVAKTKKETDLLGKPKPPSKIIHVSEGGNNGTKPDKNTRPVRNDYVQMQAPNGKIYKVPKADIQKYINAGGKVIG